ncbi:MAG TPA: RHS repeat-associated core domain-containing protein [Bryobacteraceae bacterium]|nr:RHS repeat-associated core domain-containing protein [Bryobacteraceae bacterium]
MSGRATDQAGNQEAVTYPSGLKVTTCYDGANRPKKVVKGDASSTTHYAKDIVQYAADALKKMQTGASYERACLNTRLQVSAIGIGNSLHGDLCTRSNTDFLFLKTEYQTPGVNDNDGNPVKQTMETPKKPSIGGWLTLEQTHQYDGVNRVLLTTETTVGESPAASWSYKNGYDPYGNRWQDTTGTTSPNLTAPSGADWFSTASNRLAKSTAGILALGAYDGAGNLVSHPDFGQMAYDSENRLTNWQNGAVQFRYDGQGRRVQKQIGSRIITYVYDAGGQLAAEYDTAASTNTGTQYRHEDQLGSTRLVTQAGAVVSRRDFFPFGEEIPANVTFGKRNDVDGYNQPTGFTQQFTSKERDAETGLDYFGARYFSGAQGRFTSPDLPANYLVSLPQSWNKYIYALNNPLAIVDPDGQFPKWVHEQIIDQISGLSPNDKAVLKAASADADSFLKGGQSPSASFTHAMLDGLEFSSAQTDPTKAAQFVENQIRKAIGIQAAYAANHRNQAPSLSPDAL